LCTNGKILGKPHHFPRFYYSYEVSSGGGGGRSYSSGSYTTGETAIKADIETQDGEALK
jgi:hypothetical protein